MELKRNRARIPSKIVEKLSLARLSINPSILMHRLDIEKRDPQGFLGMSFSRSGAFTGCEAALEFDCRLQAG